MPFHDARKFTDAGRRDGTDAKTDAYTVPVTDRRRSSSIAKGSTRSQCTLLVLYACDQHGGNENEPALQVLKMQFFRFTCLLRQVSPSIDDLTNHNDKGSSQLTDRVFC